VCAYSEQIFLQDELGKFFRSQEEVFFHLTEKDVRQRTESIIKGLLDPPTSYSEEASNFWDAIITGLPFDWTTRVIKELHALTPVTVQEVAKAWLFDPASRRSVALMLFGNNCLQELERFKEQDSMGQHASDFFPAPSAIVTSEESLTAIRDSLELFDEPIFTADA
jgi:secreted Zn-dependent insulinase-like peptidase